MKIDLSTIQGDPLILLKIARSFANQLKKEGKDIDPKKVTTEMKNGVYNELLDIFDDYFKDYFDYEFTNDPRPFPNRRKKRKRKNILFLLIIIISLFSFLTKPKKMDDLIIEPFFPCQWVEIKQNHYIENIKVMSFIIDTYVIVYKYQNTIAEVKWYNRVTYINTEYNNVDPTYLLEEEYKKADEEKEALENTLNLCNEEDLIE